MAMQPLEIVAGPIAVWLAPEGTAFPTVNAVPPAPWAILGKSGTLNQEDDGVTLTHGQKVETVTPAGSTGPVKAIRTEETQMISVKIWDLLAGTYRLALNNGTITTVAAAAGSSGYRKIGLSRGHEVATYALMLRGTGLSPELSGGHIQYEVPRVFQNGSPKLLYKKGKPAGLEFEFETLVDLNATDVSEQFGRMLTLHAPPL